MPYTPLKKRGLRLRQDIYALWALRPLWADKAEKSLLDYAENVFGESLRKTLSSASRD